MHIYIFNIVKSLTKLKSQLAVRKSIWPHFQVFYRQVFLVLITTAVLTSVQTLDKHLYRNKVYYAPDSSRCDKCIRLYYFGLNTTEHNEYYNIIRYDGVTSLAFQNERLGVGTFLYLLLYVFCFYRSINQLLKPGLFGLGYSVMRCLL